MVTHNAFLLSSTTDPRSQEEKRRREQRRQITRLAEKLKALSDPTRLELLRLIADPVDRNVFELVGLFDKEQPTISHHLRLLRDKGFVDYQPSGLFHHYFIDETTVAELCNELLSLIFPGVGYTIDIQAKEPRAIDIIDGVDVTI